MNDTFRAMLWLMDYKLYVMYRIKSFRLTLGDLQNHFTYWKWKPLQSRHANVLIKSTDNRTRGYDFKFIKQTCSVDATKYYFTNRVVNVWNSLPSHVVSSSTLSTFKSRFG